MEGNEEQSAPPKIIKCGFLDSLAKIEGRKDEYPAKKETYISVLRTWNRRKINC